MRNRMIIMVIVGIVLLVVGCSTQRYDSEYVRDANWTSDGKIVYLVEKKSTWIQRNPIYEQEVRNSTVARLWECDSDGNNKEVIGEIDSCEGGISYYGMSSVGNKVVMSISDTVNTTQYTVEIVPALFVMNRNGSGLTKIGTKGFYPSMSPDGSKVVYKEWGGGIRMMNIDGSNDHIFLDDTSLTAPQWSPDGGYIAVNQHNARTKIYNLNMELKKVIEKSQLDNDSIKYTAVSCWDTEDSNSVYVTSYFVNEDKSYKAKIKFNFTNDILEISYYYYPGTSYKENNSKVIAYDGNLLVCDIDGNNKWYLEP